MAHSGSIPIPDRSSSINVAQVSISRSPVATMAALSLSVSPTQTTLRERMRADSITHAIRQPKVLRPVDKDEIKLLLLENISTEAVNAFREQGFQVDHHTKSLSEDELVAKIGQYHAIGIRSKTKITQRVLQAASRVKHSYHFYSSQSLIFFLAPRHRVLLHWHKPSRPPERCSHRHPGLQLSLLQLPFSRRARRV